jgi:hypothetical protein
MVSGGSSGADLVLRAAPQNPALSKLTLWEPPYHVDDSAPRLPHDFAARLDALSNSPAWITKAGKAVARTIPYAVHRVIDGQTHNVSPTALIPELLEFFTA